MHTCTEICQFSLLAIANPANNVNKTAKYSTRHAIANSTYTIAS